MNVIFISPAFPPHFYLFCQALAERGVTVLGLGDTPPEELRPELRAALTDYAHLPNLWDLDRVVRTVGMWTWKHGKINRVDSLNEHWLPLDARIREEFNVPGPKVAELTRQRSKSGMRDILRGAGIPCTDGEPVRDAAQVQAFAQRHGFPLVFKPDTGVGAANTFKVNSQAELEGVLHALPQDAVVEGFLDGRLVSFDGLTDTHGRIIYCTNHVNSSGVMEMVNEQRDVALYSRREIPPAVADAGTRTVEAFGLKERFFHVECFEMPDGSVRVLEINLRPPGGFLTDMMNWGSDVDVYRLWARVLTGDTAGFSYERKYHCAHVARRYQYRYAVSYDDVVRNLGDALLRHGPMPQVWARAMGDHMFLVRFAELEHLQHAMAMIHQRA